LSLRPRRKENTQPFGKRSAELRSLCR
jgi:hypothetical protein